MEPDFIDRRSDDLIFLTQTDIGLPFSYLIVSVTIGIALDVFTISILAGVDRRDSTGRAISTIEIIWQGRLSDRYSATGSSPVFRVSAAFDKPRLLHIQDIQFTLDQHRTAKSARFAS